MAHLAHLSDRAVLSVEGEDRVAFLQGLVSNDVTLVAPGRAVFAALLSPQGKWLADFFILSDGARLLLDCEAEHAAMLTTRLTRFRLRAKVAITRSPLNVYAAWDGEPDLHGRPVAAAAADPRLGTAGWRVLADEMAADAGPAEYDAHRLTLGLPDGSRDLESDKTVLLEAAFDRLHGVSWTKGCYMGQELTARTHYRGLMKRRMTPVAIDGPAPPHGTPILSDGVEVGSMRSSRGDVGIALLRLGAIATATLACGGTALHVRHLDWMETPVPAEAD